jgi:hypothetical protein
MDDEFDGLTFREPMKAKYTSRCQVTPDHMIEVGQPMALVFVEGEPDPLGYGCASCLAAITEARRAAMRRS